MIHGRLRDKNPHQLSKAICKMKKNNDPLAYNLFRRSGHPDLYCAVPDCRTVPSFITKPAWDFAGTVLDEASAPLGFRMRPAQEASIHQGFYVFHRIPDKMTGASSCRS
jgi:hypothetical protein